ncbi:MAG: hypothetical protein GXO87_15155 [Chlorobi bacterium]|nr:hypothetical protein [Chlorobiota bacterium]
MKSIIKIILLAFLIGASATYAQTESDTVSVVTNDSLFVMTKSPWGAVLRSAIIPGWGQIYNESYWKAPIFWAALGGFIYGWTFYDDLYDKYAQLYSESINDDSGDGSYLRQRDFYRDQRDLMSVYIGLTYLLNLIDAYVDAHLFDFDVGENLQIRVPEVRMKFYFNR